MLPVCDGITVARRICRLSDVPIIMITAKTHNGLDWFALLSIEAVSKIAVNATGSGEAVECSLDKNDGSMLWEVTVKSYRSQTAVKINIQTSEVIEIELD